MESNDQKLGFLFDVDGVLTLPVDQDNPRSIIDQSIIKYLEKLLLLKFPTAFVTGRGHCWMNENFLNRLSPIIKKDSYIFIEYGLLFLQNDPEKLIIQENDFRTLYYQELLNQIDEICREQDILFEKDKVYCDYPSHGSLWVEDKKVMISLASNSKIPTTQVHEILNKIDQELKKHVRIIFHHLGADILPAGWSKAKAAEFFKDRIGSRENIAKWFVFGDNDSDKEMCNPFENVRFIDTKIGSSNTTIAELEKILTFN